MTMWTCRKCGRAFAHPNQWHSCQHRPLGDHLKGTTAGPAFRAFEKAVRACGPVRVVTSKTMITFAGRRIFASVKILKSGVRGELLVPMPKHVYAFTLAGPKDVAALRSRIKAAYALGSKP